MKAVNPNSPKGLTEAIRYFSDFQISLDLVAKSKWPGGPECPRCASKRLSFIHTRLLWKCLECRKQISVKVGTIFEDSAVPLDKWLTALWLLSNCRNGINPGEMARAIGVKQRTARFMLQRIRYAMHRQSPQLTGTVELDDGRLIRGW